MQTCGGLGGLFQSIMDSQKEFLSFLFEIKVCFEGVLCAECKVCGKVHCSEQNCSREVKQILLIELPKLKGNSSLCKGFKKIFIYQRETKERVLAVNGAAAMLETKGRMFMMN